MTLPDPTLDVVAAVLRSRKYRHVAPELVARLSRHALAVQGRSPKEAVAAVKRALHQAYGSFIAGAPPYARLRRELAQAAGESEQALRAALARAMRHHASTRERAPVLESFYAQLFSGGVPARVLDLGCGLNPLSVPCWPAVPARYDGIELDAALCEFVQDCLPLLGVRGEVRSADLLGSCELPAADVALMLKLYPTLEQQVPGAALALLERIDAPLVVVSFPTHSLGTRRGGLAQQSSTRFEAVLQERAWRAERLSFPSELVYLVHTR